MAVIHHSVAANFNSLLHRYFFQTKGKSIAYQPASVEFEGHPDTPTEIYIGLSEKLLASLYLQNKRWTLYVFKVNKDGSVSKRFSEKFIYLTVPEDQATDTNLIVKQLMLALLDLENYPDCLALLATETSYQKWYKPAMKAALAAPSFLESRQEREVRENKKTYKTLAWIVGIFFAVVLFGQSQNSTVPADCYFIPDQRGGQYECD